MTVAKDNLKRQMKEKEMVDKENIVEDFSDPKIVK